jgi:hypothetical protein
LPKGIFLLTHDEIKGPVIKCSYYTSPISLPQEFISKLYMSHAGFKTTSNIELKLRNYRSVSCFTGNLDRRSQMEGILGIIFEDSETYNNLDFFLHRNLIYALGDPNNQTMKDIFSNKLLEYLELNRIMEKVEIENIKEIFILQGNDKFKSCPLKLGEMLVSNSEMIDIYRKIIEKQEIPQYHYCTLDIRGKDNFFVIFKVQKSNSDIDGILLSIKPYLEKYHFYSLEILALFLLPSVLGITSINPKLSKIYPDNRMSILHKLKKSNNYAKEFNDIISYLIKGEILLCSLI